MEITYNNSILKDNQRKEWEDYINSQIAEYDEGLNLIFQAQKENIHLSNRINTLINGKKASLFNCSFNS